VDTHVRLLGRSSNEPHLSQIYTGFGLLARRGDLRVSVEPLNARRPSGRVLLRAVVNGSVRLVYDLADGTGVDDEGLEWCAAYFKRSYNSDTHGAAKKVHPLGLNYAVYARHDFRYRRMIWLLRELRPSNASRVLGKVARLTGPVSAAAWRSRAFAGASELGCAASMIGTLESPPRVSSSPKVLCFARTWDASQEADWRELNETRAGCIRALRREFGPMFIGGLVASPDALRDYPDCVVDQAVVRKPAYLAAMKSSDVCVTTRGLRGSNGWRLGEYVAASRAIVTERLLCEVPGAFADGRNYLGFDTVEQCVSNVRRLVDDADLRGSMMQANLDYYQRYVRPDALVLRSLETVLSTPRSSEVVSGGECKTGIGRMARGNGDVPAGPDQSTGLTAIDINGPGSAIAPAPS
jgi:hypothetical protein